MIAFLHPWALAGLAAAIVPFLLHLLTRRDPPSQVFPAVRYLVEATQEREQRRRLQHWLLLLIRTLLIVALVLAAAGPSIALRGVPGHAPAALVLVLDNSVSSGAVAEGTPRLAALTQAARAALQRATPDDALWLLLADGVPRRGEVAQLRALLDSVVPAPIRLDLGRAVRTAGELLASERRPGEILVLTDGQRTAFSAAEALVPLTVAMPDDAPPANVGLATVALGPQPWAPAGGRVAVEAIGDSGRGAQLELVVGARPARQTFAQPGASVSLAVGALPAGWQPIRLTLDADELRADDLVETAVRVSLPSRADCSASGRWSRAACEVLQASGRLAAGSDVRLGELGTAASVVEPPADAARLGAVNRALAARGVPWQYGALGPAGRVDSGLVASGVRIDRRLILVPSGSGRSGVLATVGGAPWLVSFRDVVLIGSRLEPEWTELPIVAAFVPFIDLLLNRTVRGVLPPIVGAPGEPSLLPDRVTEVRYEARSWRVEPGAAFRPPLAGRYFLLAGQDTVGVLASQVDPRESRLAPAASAEISALWPNARVVPLARAGAEAFAHATRGDLRGPLLWLALLLGLAEVFLASARRRRAV